MQLYKFTIKVWIYYGPCQFNFSSAPSATWDRIELKLIKLITCRFIA